MRVRRDVAGYRAMPAWLFLCAAVLGQGAPVFAQSGLPAFPLRSIHLSGNWGTNPLVVADWHRAGEEGPLVPEDYLAWLGRLHVDWVGLSVALTYDDSMDSSVERNRGHAADDVDAASFSDAALRQMIRDFKGRGIDVYLTLAFEAHEAAAAARPVHRWQLGDPGSADGGPCCDSGIRPEFWPWRPDHPDHARFVAEFWQTYTREAVHVATIAEEEGVRLFSLGTETDRLFRTRSGGYFVNDFGAELRSMVDQVRAAYSGLLTYDMHYSVLLDPDFFGAGSDYLWSDLDLDVVGVSAWFPVVESHPVTVTDVGSLRVEYERIFQDYLVPLNQRNPTRPVVFLEYGAMDLVEAPRSPAGGAGFPPFVFTDANGNGLDDGRETQANMYQALLDVMNAHPGVLDGVFWWDNWMTDEERWASYWAGRRSFAIRAKPAEEIVRSAYAALANNRPPAAVSGTLPDATLTLSGTLTVDVSQAFVDPDRDPLTYEVSSSAPGVVAARAAGARVTLTAVGEGTATIRVTATDPGGLSATQSFTVTVSTSVSAPFTDDPLQRGVTPVRAVHFTELRTRIDALRGAAGLQRFSWTDPVLRAGMTRVRRVHLLELRSALVEAYRASGRAAPRWTDASPAVGSTPIRAAHVTELRAAVLALE